MTTSAKHAFGSQLARLVSGEYRALAMCSSINGISLAREPIDVTALDSEQGYREFIPGLKSVEELTLELFANPTDASQVGLLTDLESSSALQTWRLFFTDFGATTQVVTDVDNEELQTTGTHGWATGTPLTFSTDGTLPSPAKQGVVYYAEAFDTTHIILYRTNALALEGLTFLDYGSDNGTGTHTLNGPTWVQFSAFPRGYSIVANTEEALRLTATLAVSGGVTFDS